MKIAIIENSAKKMLEHLQIKSDSNSALYDKSKPRLKCVADICYQAIDIINALIELEPQENKSTPDMSLQEQVEFLAGRVEKLESLIQVGTPIQTKVSEPVNQPQATNLPASNNQLTPLEKKAVVRNYGDFLKNLAESGYNIVEVNQCADILWRWYDARIFKKYSNAPPFNYSVWIPF